MLPTLRFRCPALMIFAALAGGAAPPPPDPTNGSGRDREEEYAAELSRLRAELAEARIALLEARREPFRKEGDARGEAGLLVRQGLGDALPRVRLHALTALREIPAIAVVPHAEGILARESDPDAAVRAAALGLAVHAGLPGAPARVEAALVDPDAAVRRAAAEALAAGACGPDAGPRLLPLLEDPEADVRHSAVRALGRLRPPEAGPALLQFLRAERAAESREAAIDALGEIAYAPAATDLILILRRSPSRRLRWSAANALGRLGGEPRAAAALLPILTDRTAPPDLREIAVQSLGRLQDPGAIDPLGAILRGDPDPHLREEAARALAAFGARPDAERELVSAAASDPEPSVRLKAWQALKLAAGPAVADRISLGLRLVERGRTEEPEELVREIAGMPAASAADASRLAELRESLAGAYADRGDHRRAFFHRQTLSADRPDLLPLRLRAVDSAEALGDFPAALALLLDGLKYATIPADRWTISIRTTEILIAADRAPEAILTQIRPTLRETQPPPPPDVRERLETLRTRAYRILLDRLADPDASSIAAADLVGLGRPAVPNLAAELEDDSRAATHPLVVQILERVTGRPIALDLPASAAARAAVARRLREEGRPTDQTR